MTTFQKLVLAIAAAIALFGILSLVSDFPSKMQAQTTSANWCNREWLSRYIAGKPEEWHLSVLSVTPESQARYGRYFLYSGSIHISRGSAAIMLGRPLPEGDEYVEIVRDPSTGRYANLVYMCPE